MDKVTGYDGVNQCQYFIPGEMRPFTQFIVKSNLAI
jgi:hypothetical protein